MQSRLCRLCNVYALDHKWDELMKCCTDCSGPLERPDLSWMRRDPPRRPPNLKRFAKLGSQLELERQERMKARNAEVA